jgi:hypothetical protein
MVQLQLTGQNLGQVLNSSLGRAFLCHAIALITKTGYLKAENLTQATLRFLPLDAVLVPKGQFTLEKFVKKDTFKNVHNTCLSSLGAV